jgi:serine protease Do
VNRKVKLTLALTRRSLLILSIAMSAPVLIGLPGALFAADNLPDTIDLIKPSLVAIGLYQNTRNPRFQPLSTGFVVGDGNMVATNAHSIPITSDARDPATLTIMVRKADGTLESRAGSRLASDLEHDIAVLKFEGAPLTPLKLASADTKVREGQAVAFSGFPLIGALGAFPSTNRAIISAIAPIAIPSAAASQLGNAQIKRLAMGSFDVFQLDAIGYAGNSGSPVYNTETGLVVGIVNMVFVRTSKETALTYSSGITYAIPIRHLIELLRRMK